MIGKLAVCEYRPGELTYFCLARPGVWTHHQGPVFFEHADGRVRLIWSAYREQECDNDTVLLYAVSGDGGETWTDPQVFMKSPGANASHPYLLRVRPSGEVLMLNRENTFVGGHVDPVTCRVKVWSDYGASPNCRIVLRRSVSDGEMWNFGQPLDTNLIVPDFKSNFYASDEGILQLSSGRILVPFVYLPYEHRDPQHFHVSIVVSDDGGITWRRSAVWTVPQERGAMEPQIVEWKIGHLYCLMRNKSGYLYETRSHDDGETWSEPAMTTIPSPEAICRVMKLQSGAVLLVWNNVHTRDSLPRYPLTASLTEDGGRSWSPPKVIATESGTNHLSNFSMIQLRDGRILLGVSNFITIQPTVSNLHLALFDEAWLRL